MARQEAEEVDFHMDSEDDEEGLNEDDEDEEVRAVTDHRPPHPPAPCGSRCHHCRGPLPSQLLSCDLHCMPSACALQPMLLARARPGAAANRLPLHHFLRLIAGGRMMEHGVPACPACCMEAVAACLHSPHLDCMRARHEPTWGNLCVCSLALALRPCHACVGCRRRRHKRRAGSKPEARGCHPEASKHSPAGLPAAGCQIQMRCQPAVFAPVVCCTATPACVLIFPPAPACHPPARLPAATACSARCACARATCLCPRGTARRRWWMLPSE